MLSSNEVRTCALCKRSFEVPRGYPPAAGWQCARCLLGLPCCLVGDRRPVRRLRVSCPVSRRKYVNHSSAKADSVNVRLKVA